MTWDAWWETFSALSRRQRPGQPISGEDAKEFYAVLSDVSDDGAERAVDQWTRENARMPKPAELLALVRATHRANPARRDVCGTCHGSTWVPALPCKSHGHVVEGVKRCPDCGIPSPSYTPIAHQEPLTASEYQRYIAAKAEPREPVALPPHLEAIRQRLWARVSGQ